MSTKTPQLHPFCQSRYKVYVSYWGPDFLCADFQDLNLSGVKSLAIIYEDLGLRPIGQMASLTDLVVVGLRSLISFPLNHSTRAYSEPGCLYRHITSKM